MTVRLYAFTCGWLTGPLAPFLDGETGTVRMPVPAFLIDHPKGRALFDSGLNVKLRTDADRLVRGIAGMRYEFGAEADIASRLIACDIDPRSIRYLINSHLHFDHCGGNALIPNAIHVVQKREWQAAREGKPSSVLNPADYNLGHHRLEIDGEYDLYGDGCVILMPTYGHTAGHQSLHVRLPKGDVVLAADSCYFCRSLDNLHLPPRAYDLDMVRVSLLKLRSMRAQGVHIIYGHDEEFWRTVPQAPSPIL